MRSFLRKQLLSITRRILLCDDGRDILCESLCGQAPPTQGLPDVSLLTESPYPDVSTKSEPAAGRPAVFITGRFRSGSTLLWNVFRHISGCTAYYEPLNERCWFDAGARGQHTDKTHKHVEDYWREYEGLAELGQYYREDWICRQLYMDERAWDPNLKRYIEILLARSAGLPVLQFNRVDFRLPWLRVHFPQAKIIHLYRHPRDQWLSTLYGDRFPTTSRIADFQPFDRFYLLPWTRDLRRQFPFLNLSDSNHPYELFYLVWRLSYVFGRQFADRSLSFESLVQDPESELSSVFSELGIQASVNERILRLIERPTLGKWTEYADDDWFARHERRCDRLLADFFSGVQPVNAPAENRIYSW